MRGALRHSRTAKKAPKLAPTSKKHQPAQLSPNPPPRRDKPSAAPAATKANSISAVPMGDGRHSRRELEYSIDKSCKRGVLRALSAHAPAPQHVVFSVEQL